MGGGGGRATGAVTAAAGREAYAAAPLVGVGTCGLDVYAGRALLPSFAERLAFILTISSRPFKGQGIRTDRSIFLLSCWQIPASPLSWMAQQS
jgi:hypothetical protein